MVNNVFSTPITAEDYPVRRERAKVAYDKREADGRLLEAEKFVQDEKAKYGDGVSTLGLIYNATGEAIHVVTSKDWYGHNYSPYPTRIENGQWGGFLHIKPAVLPSGSEAAVVYGGKTDQLEDCEVMIAWNNPWNKPIYPTNSVLTLIHDAGYFTTKVWDDIYNTLNEGNPVSSIEYKGIGSSITIDDGTSPYMRPMLTFNLTAAEQ